MVRKLAENILTIIVTVVLLAVIGGFMLSHYEQSQKQVLQPLQEQNEALRNQIDENRRDLEATAHLIRQAVNNQNGGMFSSSEEIANLNQSRMNALADAIAQRVAPKLPPTRTPEQLAQQENEQIDRISTATADKLQPAINSLTAAQQSAGATAQQLAAAQTENQKLQANLDSTQKAADDALALTQQLSTMYLATYRDKGAVVHILSLPAELIQDTVTGNVIDGNRARSREQQKLDAQIKDIQDRLNQIRSESAQPVASD